MIKLQNVCHTIQGPAGPVPALKDVCLQVEKGESVALMGANGSGKSTLCRCANGLLIPRKGSVTVDGLSTRDAGACVEIRRRVGMVFQDPSQQLVTWSVADEIAFGPENLGWPTAEVETAVKRGLEKWGLTGLAGRHPQHMSGGQMAAVALASVLAMGPSYLVVDEPGSLLDRAGRSRLLRALGEAGKDGNVGLLMVTQDPEEALRCDRLVILSRGEVVADGDPEGILTSPGDLRKWGLEPSPATLLSWRARDLGAGLSRIHVGVWPLLSELESMGLKAVPGAAGGADQPEAEQIVTFEDAGYAYDGEGRGVRGLDFSVAHGEGLGLAGPSGSGKSTAVYLASGALRPKWGVVRRGTAHSTKGGVGLCAQFPEEQFCQSTVGREIVSCLRESGGGPETARRWGMECLEMVGLDPGLVVDRAPLSLSEGEKKKVALASALACGGELLVLDEPTLGLDGPSAELATRSVIRHLESGGGAIVASHCGDFLLRATGRLLLFEAGRPPALLRWEGGLVTSPTPGFLPEGQLLDLCAWLGGLPEKDSLASMDSLVDRLAARLVRLLDAASQNGFREAPPARGGPESGVRSGKCP